MMPLQSRRPFRLLLVVHTVVAVGSLFAGGPSLAQAQSRPCEEDIKKLCPDANPGSLRKCLEENREKLSEPCQKRLGQGGRRGYPARFQGCEADLDKFCKGITPGAGRLLRCLRDHNSELSEQCTKRLGARGGGMAQQAKGTQPPKPAETQSVIGTEGPRPAETPGGAAVGTEDTPKAN